MPKRLRRTREGDCWAWGLRRGGCVSASDASARPAIGCRSSLLLPDYRAAAALFKSSTSRIETGASVESRPRGSSSRNEKKNRSPVADANAEFGFVRLAAFAVKSPGGANRVRKQQRHADCFSLNSLSSALSSLSSLNSGGGGGRPDPQHRNGPDNSRSLLLCECVCVVEGVTCTGTIPGTRNQRAGARQ